jgi:hypothetical protein
MFLALLSNRSIKILNKPQKNLFKGNYTKTINYLAKPEIIS